MSFLILLVLLQEPDAEIRSLIEKLGSERIEVREEATQKLKKLGDAAKPALESAAKSGDAERAARARSVLRFFEVRAKLTPALLKAIPDAADRLALSDKAWTEVFLEATGNAPISREPKFPDLMRADLQALAGPAVEFALERKEKAKVLNLVYRWRLTSALPAAEKSLSDPDEDVRVAAFMALWLGGPETTPRFAAALKDESVRVRRHAIGVLLDRKEHVEEIREMLEKGPRELKATILIGLMHTEGRSATKETVLRHIDDLQGESAAQVLSWLGDPDQAPRLFKMTGDKDEYVRGAALTALCHLGARQYLDEMIRWLDDEDKDVRVKGAVGVSRLGRPEHGKKMLFLLKDEEKKCRLTGLARLRDLDAPEYIADIRPLLNDPEEAVRWYAAEALNSLSAALTKDLLPLADPSDPRYGGFPLIQIVADMAMRESPARQDEIAAFFKKLEGHASREVSDAASIALVRMGRKDRAAQREFAHRLAHTHPRWWNRYVILLCEGLALANEPRLRETIDVKKDVETLEDINELLKPAQLEVRVEVPVRVMIRKGRRLTRFEVLLRLQEGLTPVVEKDVVTMMRPQQYPLDRWCEILK